MAYADRFLNVTAEQLGAAAAAAHSAVLAEQQAFAAHQQADDAREAAMLDGDDDSTIEELRQRVNDANSRLANATHVRLQAEIHQRLLHARVARKAYLDQCKADYVVMREKVALELAEQDLPRLGKVVFPLQTMKNGQLVSTWQPERFNNWREAEERAQARIRGGGGNKRVVAAGWGNTSWKRVPSLDPGYALQEMQALPLGSPFTSEEQMWMDEFLSTEVENEKLITLKGPEAKVIRTPAEIKEDAEYVVRYFAPLFTYLRGLDEVPTLTNPTPPPGLSPNMLAFHREQTIARTRARNGFKSVLQEIELRRTVGTPLPSRMQRDRALWMCYRIILTSGRPTAREEVHRFTELLTEFEYTNPNTETKFVLLPFDEEVSVMAKYGYYLYTYPEEAKTHTEVDRVLLRRFPIFLLLNIRWQHLMGRSNANSPLTAAAEFQRAFDRDQIDREVLNPEFDAPDYVAQALAEAGRMRGMAPTAGAIVLPENEVRYAPHNWGLGNFTQYYPRVFRLFDLRYGVTFPWIQLLKPSAIERHLVPRDEYAKVLPNGEENPETRMQFTERKKKLGEFWKPFEYIHVERAWKEVIFPIVMVARVLEERILRARSKIPRILRDQHQLMRPFRAHKAELDAACRVLINLISFAPETAVRIKTFDQQAMLESGLGSLMMLPSQVGNAFLRTCCMWEQVPKPMTRAYEFAEAHRLLELLLSHLLTARRVTDRYLRLWGRTLVYHPELDARLTTAMAVLVHTIVVRGVPRHPYRSRASRGLPWSVFTDALVSAVNRIINRTEVFHIPVPERHLYVLIDLCLSPEFVATVNTSNPKQSEVAGEMTPDEALVDILRIAHTPHMGGSRHPPLAMQLEGALLARIRMMQRIHNFELRRENRAMEIAYALGEEGRVHKFRGGKPLLFSEPPDRRFQVFPVAVETAIDQYQNAHRGSFTGFHPRQLVEWVLEVNPHAMLFDPRTDMGMQPLLLEMMQERVKYQGKTNAQVALLRAHELDKLREKRWQGKVIPAEQGFRAKLWHPGQLDYVKSELTGRIQTVIDLARRHVLLHYLYLAFDKKVPVHEGNWEAVVAALFKRMRGKYDSVPATTIEDEKQMRIEQAAFPMRAPDAWSGSVVPEQWRVDVNRFLGDEPILHPVPIYCWLHLMAGFMRGVLLRMNQANRNVAIALFERYTSYEQVEEFSSPVLLPPEEVLAALQTTANGIAYLDELWDADQQRKTKKARSSLSSESGEEEDGATPTVYYFMRNPRDNTLHLVREEDVSSNNDSGDDEKEESQPAAQRAARDAADVVAALLDADLAEIQAMVDALPAGAPALVLPPGALAGALDAVVAAGENANAALDAINEVMAAGGLEEAMEED